MTAHLRWRLGAIVFVLLAIFLVSGAHLCGIALDRAAADPGMRPIGNSGLACTEFWLNRYQTLIGALVAVGAASFAWIGVRRQIEKADQQIAVANRQNAIALLPALDQRNEHALKLYSLAEEILGINIILFGFARDSVSKSTELYEWYMRGQGENRLIQVFDSQVQNYKAEIDVYTKWSRKLLEEYRRGLATPECRRLSHIISCAARDALMQHRALLPKLERCTGNKFRDNNEITQSFEAIGSFDPQDYLMPDVHYAIPLRELMTEVVKLQTERDQCLERSRV